MRIPKKFPIFFTLFSYMVAPFCGCTVRKASGSVGERVEKSNSFCEYISTDSQARTPIWNASNVDVSRVDKRRKLIAFTFDDAPSGTLEDLIAVFLGYNATHPDAPAFATIFCNGCRIHRPIDSALHTAVTAGFELGNHTQNHKRLTTLSPDKLREEIDKTDERLFRYDGERRHLFRAPYGELNAEVCKAVGAPIIDWFVDTLDWTGISADSIYDTVWERKSSGTIVLMHDGYENTLRALKRLLPDLYEAGYQAVTVSQMAKVHQCPLKIGSVYTRARKKTP